MNEINAVQIEGLDEDNCRVMVKLTLSGNMVSQSQYNIKLVNSKEYKKFSKYLSKLRQGTQYNIRLVNCKEYKKFSQYLRVILKVDIILRLTVKMVLGCNLVIINMNLVGNNM